MVNLSIEEEWPLIQKEILFSEDNRNRIQLIQHLDLKEVEIVNLMVHVEFLLILMITFLFVIIVIIEFKYSNGEYTIQSEFQLIPILKI